MTTPLRKRERLERRWGALKSDRSTWFSHWEDINRNLLPRSGRFFRQDKYGDKKSSHIYDSTGTQALRTLASGMMAGATSPARPWFRLGPIDPELEDSHDVKVWVEEVAKRMQRVFARSNTYGTLHGLYEELAAFGTAADFMVEDFGTIVHHHPMTIGEFALAQNYKGEIDTLYREFERSVIEVVEEFGIENVSTTVKHLFDQHQFDQPVGIIHAVEPRTDRDFTQRDSRNMRWRSVYFELGTENPDKVLRESGFDEFPVLAPRWGKRPGDVYGIGPGMDALPDVRGLQQEQLRKHQAIDFQTRPPMQAPTALKNRDVQGKPGGVTFVDSPHPNGGLRPAWQATLNVRDLRESISETQFRITRTFFADLFLMLASAGPDTRMTAEEVRERHEEKLIMLGPTLERLHNELLTPLIDRTFTHMAQMGALPPPPEEISGRELKVEFISALAQAQRQIGVNNVDRWTANLGAIAQMKPEILDKFNPDEWADAYADMLGIPPELIVPNEQVVRIRRAREEALAAKEQAALMQQQAATVRDLAAADTGGANALTDTAQAFEDQDASRQFSGLSSPSPLEV